MNEVKGLNCPECPPEQAHDILFKCSRCKGSYCSEHKNKDDHECVFSPEIVSDEPYLPPRMKPELIKSQINHLILSTRGWITLGFEPLDYAIGLVFVLFAGVFQLYLTRTIPDLDFILLVIGLVLVYSIPLFFQRQVAFQVGAHPRYVLNQTGMILTVLTGILSFGVIQPGQVIPFGATHAFQKVRVSSSGPTASLTVGFMLVLLNFGPFNTEIISKLIDYSAMITLSYLLPIGYFEGRTLLAYNTMLWFFLVCGGAFLFII